MCQGLSEGVCPSSPPTQALLALGRRRLWCEDKKGLCQGVPLLKELSRKHCEGWPEGGVSKRPSGQAGSGGGCKGARP